MKQHRLQLLIWFHVAINSKGVQYAPVETNLVGNTMVWYLGVHLCNAV